MVIEWNRIEFRERGQEKSLLLKKKKQKSEIKIFTSILLLFYFYLIVFLNYDTYVFRFALRRENKSQRKSAACEEFNERLRETRCVRNHLK